MDLQPQHSLTPAPVMAVFDLECAAGKVNKLYLGAVARRIRVMVRAAIK
jgi:hypothetical protein